MFDVFEWVRNVISGSLKDPYLFTQMCIFTVAYRYGMWKNLEM